MRQEVCQLLMRDWMEVGKSLPLSTIQPIFFETGGGEKSRAPRAE
jgi:hypothetical protein